MVVAKAWTFPRVVSQQGRYHELAHRDMCVHKDVRRLYKHVLTWGEEQRIQDMETARPSSCSVLGDVSKVHCGICFPSLCVLPCSQFLHSSCS